MGLNPELVKMARWQTRKNAVKLGFVPSDAVAGGPPPGAGGGPPGPGGGGGPPPGPPPGPPQEAGGGGGAAPPPPPGMPSPPPSGGGGDPMLMARLDKLEQMIMGGGGGAGIGGATGGMGAAKAQNSIKPAEMDSYQTKKMVMHLAKHMGIDFPPDLLDGPNRDPRTGQPLPPNTPGSTSDPNTMAGGSGGGAAPQSAIKPMEPMGAAFPSPPGGPGGGAPGKMAAAVENVDKPRTVGVEIGGFAKQASRAAQLAQAWRLLKK